MDNGRKVIVSEYIRDVNGEESPTGKCELGIFKEFSVGWEFAGVGAGMFATAIVEYEDGTMKNVRAEHVRFVDEVRTMKTCHKKFEYKIDMAKKGMVDWQLEKHLNDHGNEGWECCGMPGNHFLVLKREK